MGTCTCWGEGTRFKSDNSVVFDRAQGVLYTDVRHAVSAFRKHSAIIVQSIIGAAGAPRVDVACSLVEAILLGVHDHLPKVKVNFKLFLTEPADFTEESDVISLLMQFDAEPLIGEIATRSRIPHSVQLASPVRFSLRMPTARDEDPLVLRLNGLSMPSLPDIALLDEHLRSALGPSFDADSSYNWWQLNKDQHFPHRTSKLRRLIESLHEQKLCQMQRRNNVFSFWGYCRVVPLVIDAFEFYGSASVTMTARLRPTTDPHEAQIRAQGVETTRSGLTTYRKLAEQCCQSAMNFAALLHAHEVGQPRANAKAIIKLFSPAKWWGPGKDGWQVWDETWLCSDKKNSFGLVTERQGRILWHKSAHISRSSQSGQTTASSEYQTRKSTSLASICLMALVVMFTVAIIVANTEMTQKFRVTNVFDD